MEEYEKLSGEKYCPGYPCENMHCYLCDGDVDVDMIDMLREDSEGHTGAQGATASGAVDTGVDAGGGTTRRERKRWKMLVPSNFPRRSQPYRNNWHWKVAMVFLPEEQTLPTGQGFRVRNQLGGSVK